MNIKVFHYSFDPCHWHLDQTELREILRPMLIPMPYKHSALQRKSTVTAYLNSEHLLLFVVALQHCYNAQICGKYSVVYCLRDYRSDYFLTVQQTADIGPMIGHGSPRKHKTFLWYLYNVDQRRRRWADVVKMLYKSFVFAGHTTRIININCRLIGLIYTSKPVSSWT